MNKLKLRNRLIGPMEICILSVCVLYSAIAPIIISFDGYLYLASAKSLFTSDFHAFYWLEKEPLFPFVLKISTIIGIRGFVILQGLVGGISICLTLFTIRKYITSNLFILRIIGVILLLITHGWAVSILQQTFFIFFTSLNILFLCYLVEFKAYAKETYVKIFFISIINISFSVVIFAAFALATGIVLSLNHKKNPKYFVLVGLIIVSTFSAFTLSWSTAIGNTKEGRVFQPPYKSILTQYFSTDDPMIQWEQRLQATTALLSIGKENFGVSGMNLPISFEMRAYGLTNIDEDLKCGKRDPGFEPIVSYVSHLLPGKDCVDLNVAKVINRIHFWTFPLIPLLGFIFLGLGIVGFMRKQSKIFYSLASFPVVIWLEYVVVGGGSSRYGLPCIYSAVYLLAKSLDEWRTKPPVRE